MCVRKSSLTCVSYLLTWPVFMKPFDYCYCYLLTWPVYEACRLLLGIADAHRTVFHINRLHCSGWPWNSPVVNIKVHFVPCRSFSKLDLLGFLWGESYKVKREPLLNSLRSPRSRNHRRNAMTGETGDIEGGGAEIGWRVRLLSILKNSLLIVALELIFLQKFWFGRFLSPPSEKSKVFLSESVM